MGPRRIVTAEPPPTLFGAMLARFRKPSNAAPLRDEERRLVALAKAQAGPTGDKPDEN